MARWSEGEDHQRIGDIMVKNAPFLKMYTEYVKNFDTAMNTINSLYTKNSKFAAIVDEIHVSRVRISKHCLDIIFCRRCPSVRASLCSITC